MKNIAKMTVAAKTIVMAMVVLMAVVMMMGCSKGNSITGASEPTPMTIVTLNFNGTMIPASISSTAGDYFFPLTFTADISGWTQTTTYNINNYPVGDVAGANIKYSGFDNTEYDNIIATNSDISTDTFKVYTLSTSAKQIEIKFVYDSINLNNAVNFNVSIYILTLKP